MYVPGVFEGPDTNVNTVSLEQHGKDCIRPNVYPEWFDGTVEFTDFEYHNELDPRLNPRIQTPHKVAPFVESRL